MCEPKYKNEFFIEISNHLNALSTNCTPMYYELDAISIKDSYGNLINAVVVLWRICYQTLKYSSDSQPVVYVDSICCKPSPKLMIHKP